MSQAHWSVLTLVAYQTYRLLQYWLGDPPGNNKRKVHLNGFTCFGEDFFSLSIDFKIASESKMLKCQKLHLWLVYEDLWFGVSTFYSFLDIAIFGDKA